MDLEDNIYQQIIQLSEQGDELAESSAFLQAIEKYKKAFSLLPDPKDQWEACRWLKVAIGDAYYLKEEYQKAYILFQESINCPDAIGNPFIYLRTGQCLYNIGDKKKAIDALLRAYMLDGEEVFEEDQKYLTFLRSEIQL